MSLKKKNNSRYLSFIKGELINLCYPSEIAIHEDGWAEWFNNTKELQATNHGIYPNTRGLQKSFFKSLANDRSKIVLFICDKKKNKAVGVVSLQNINYQSRSADIAINASSLDKKNLHPLGTLEAMALITEHAFEEMGLRRVYGGQAFPILRTWNKMNELIGFRSEGISRQSFVRGQKVMDTVLISCLYENYIKIKNIRGSLWGSSKIIIQTMRKQHKKSYADILSHNLIELEKNYFKFLLEN